MTAARKAGSTPDRPTTVAPRWGLAERLVGGPPPRGAPLLLVVLLGLEAAAVRQPGFLPAAVAAGTALTVLAALWVSGRGAYAWVVVGALVLLPLPFSPGGAAVTVAAATLSVGGARLIRSVAGFLTAAQTTALRQYGERDELARQTRAQREQLVGQVQYWSSHDPLTEVLNRGALTRHLHDLAASGTPTGVLILSAASFAVVNEELGTDVGDELLGALAKRLRARARDTDLIARLGGDEFAVVLSGVTAEHAGPVAGRLLQVLTDPFTLGSHLVPLHARCGLALDDGSFVQGAGELLRQASTAARSAKVGGALNVFSASTKAEAQLSLALEADLHRALASDELFLLYQPLVSTRTGLIESVEALVRWQHPERGLVPPDAFIAAAERSGQILEIGLRVLELALIQLRAWGSGPAPTLSVAVNVSARQLVEPGFVEQVRSLVWGSGVDPQRVMLELTESMLVEDSEAAIATLWQLRGLGLRLAIDDFGTGYSSLARLGELPIDEMKIDKSFVDRLGDAPHDSTALVTAAVAMGHGLGLMVVAEGVEWPAQAAQLSALGCDLLQGYLLGRPQSAKDLTPQLGQRLLAESTALPGPRLSGSVSTASP